MKKETANINIGNWKVDPLENVSVGDFNNVTDKASAVFPGQYEGDSVFIRESENTEPLKTEAVKAENYAYSFVGNGYFYGIKNDNTEVIAIVKDNILTPVQQGAGRFVIKRRNGEVLLQSGAVKDYTVGEKDGYTCVTVSYEAEGLFRFAETVSSTYTFKEQCISVDSALNIIGLDTANLYSANLCKIPLNSRESYKNRISMKWQYPENNDFAFKNSDAMVFGEKFGDMAFYSAVRDGRSTKYCLREMSPDNLPLSSKESENTEYYCHVDFSVVTADEKESYKALFMGRNSDFAAGIASVNETDNTTMFMGKDLHLNINVTNIANTDINFTVKYELLDYYENFILENTSYKNILGVGEEANHNIKMSLDKYGMYFLNIYVATKNYEYRETYPFCMVEEYEYRNRDGLPFGICATHTETVGECRSTARILKKMGLSIIREGECPDRPKFREFLAENGVNRYSGGVHWAFNEAGVNGLMKAVEKSDSRFDDPKNTYYFVANEIDAPAKGNYEKSYKKLTEQYIPYTYKPIYDYVSKNHPDALKKIIWQSNCHGTTEWLEAFYDTGMWDASEFIDIHTYSSPTGPDKVYSNTLVSMHADTFSNEYAMDRWKRLVKRYGPKRMIVGETGYPTAPHVGDNAEVDPRTQADFNVRIALFLLEAGCEDILYYCIYDRTGFFVGASEWNEMYFGALYNYDYNGVYMPKPWAAAYANLTRRFDGYKKVTFFDKYEESEFGDLRAFKVETDKEEFAVLWSNIFKQPNTTAPGRMKHQFRKFLPLWTNRWEQADVREFDAVGDTVTVVDVMGNSKEIKAVNGKVTIEVTGSPIYVYGIC